MCNGKIARKLRRLKNTDKRFQKNLKRFLILNQGKIIVKEKSEHPQNFLSGSWESKV